MPVTVASCANDFKHAMLSGIKKQLNIQYDIYMLDNKKNMYGYEFYPDGEIRIVENPWYEQNNLYWSITYESGDPTDMEINPWLIPRFPIHYSYELKDILDLNPPIG
jgi:hypothetical protein